MSSLVFEYIKRHNINHINTINDGVIFFDKKSKPYCIALVSSHGRGLTTCNQCSFTIPQLTLEIYIPKSNKSIESGHHIHKAVSHSHIVPDANLLDVLQNTGLHNLKPFIPQNSLDLEKWLWNFTSNHSNQYAPSFVGMKQHSDLPSRMAWASLNAPYVMSSYYEVYSRFLFHKNYILF